MIADVEAAMIEYGRAGYNCSEIPDFVGDEPIIVAYKQDYLRNDSVMLAIEHIPEILGNDETDIYWEDGMARVEAYELTLQGYDAKYLEIHVLNIADWICVMQAVVIDDGSVAFRYADMFDAVKMELVDMGLINSSR